ncbi:MFS transporter [Streptomyces gamaensis]|uniref:MFS transporter n=1 Tax=Streptomyces gamaensis TaxID=1763542 RepID=A0ABW0YQZ6_9ACTN
MSSLSVSTSRPTTGDRGSPEQGGLSSTLVLALGTFAVGTDAFVVAGFLPSMAHDLHVSEATAGQSITVFSAAYALLSPVLATLTARLPRRALLVSALVVLGLANLLSALSPNMAVLIISRVIAAAGAAAYTPNAGAVSAALVRPQLRARALAVVVGGLTVATALGVPLGNLASHWLGWRTALGIVAGLCLVIGIGLRAIMPKLPGNERVPLRTRLAVLRRPAVLAVLPLSVLGMGASYVAYAYSVPALEAVHIPQGAILWMLFLYGLGAVLGNIASGYATDRWGSVRVLTVGYICMTVALGLLAWLAAIDTALQALVGLLVLLWGASSWCQTPSQQHRLIEVAPQEAPLVVSLNSSGIYLGIGLGTVLGGVMLPSGMPAVYGLGAALAVVSLLFLLITARATARRG